ncbi:sugar transferase [Nocardioides massiliensis]|uniref:Lipopolysaccharide/colanic/teichoic acid biosynthesis glycosyltransferase n=1 Tax=Nocardioides massiliensis TaxID=1325935 RepID=A0ABT9NNC2_9ACTN|nr:sugar transferase [Nocardioides massiliensis]MDP9821550.1 lipopolysaccharide/colanic/teichoic acid biosynthesis glycosyltransferase [Nocardioides massiliensis]
MTTYAVDPASTSTPRAAPSEAVAAVARGEYRTKRVVDLVAAATLILALLPLLTLLAAVVACTSRGPVFYRQVRVGRGGREFVVWKFRTMRPGAAHELPDLQEQNEAAGPLFKIRADPRVTRVGRVLRRTSMDELPQLFNVLTGSMSLVGPRPALPIEVARYGDAMHRRHVVRPGLTGLWQVSGRSDLPWERAVELDLQYVERCSLRLDLLILLRTVPAVLRGTGAY